LRFDGAILAELLRFVAYDKDDFYALIAEKLL
jgi:hypothetical protein